MAQTVPLQPARKANTLTWVLVGCAIPVLLVLCCGIAALGLYVTGAAQPLLALLGLAGKANVAANVPAGAPMFVAMDLDLQQAANFQKIWSIYQNAAKTQTSMSDFKTQFKDSTGCDFDQDIAAWWGPDAGIFLTDAQSLTPSSSSATANLVFAVGTRDQAKAQAAIQKCSAKQKPVSTETYKNIKINLYDPNGALAIVGNYVMLATTGTALHAVVDATVAGGTQTLAQNPSYQKLAAQLPASRVATFYMQPAAFLDAYRKLATGVQPQALDQLQAYQAVGGSLAFTENGARVDTVAMFDKTKLAPCYQQLFQQAGSTNRALNAVPANTYALFASSNFKGVWDCAMTQMDATTQTQMQSSFTQLKKLGVDVEADVISWMTGDFALAVTPGKPIATSVPGMGVIFLAEAKDQTLVNSKMNNLSAALSKQGMTFKDQKIKNVTMKTASFGSATDPNAPAFGLGMINNWMVVGGPLDALGNVVDAPNNALAKDARFQTVQSVLAAKSNGLVYVNVAGLEQLYSDFIRTTDARTFSTYQRDVQPWLKPIKAMGVSGQSGSDMATSTFFVLIQGD